MSSNGTKRTFSLLAKAATATAVAAAVTIPATGAFAAGSSTAHSVTHTRFSAAAMRQMHIRLTALGFAERQKGKYYCWGGTGPSCYDCSGLVWSSYHHAGVSLPRATYGMLGSSKLRRIAASQARPGDLAFYGSGHVELVAWGNGGTIGALQSGSPVATHPASSWFYPTMYYTLR